MKERHKKLMALRRKRLKAISKKIPLNKMQKEFATDATKVVVGFTFISGFLGLFKFLTKWIINPIKRRIRNVMKNG